MVLLNSVGNVKDSKNSAVVNPLHGKLQLIVDAELADGECYVAAGRRTIRVGYLEGTGRKPMLKINETTLIRTTFEGVFDFTVYPEDYRGLVKGN
jgi:hypothetical protein